MKTRFLTAIAALLIILSCSCIQPSYAGQSVHAADSSQYALVITTDALLYKTATDSPAIDNVYFCLPETYFVKIIEPSGELMYKAEYSGITGYVRRADISIQTFEPLSKYPTDLRLKKAGDYYLILRPQPTQSAQEIELPRYDLGEITYYNYAHGEEVNSGNTKWYYISIPFNNSVLYGYVYSASITLVTHISHPNDLSPVPAPPATEDPAAKTPPYNAITQGIIIAAICIPTVLVIYMLFKPAKPQVISHPYSSQEQPYINDPYRNSDNR